jgi:hypothetical protein
MMKNAKHRRSIQVINGLKRELDARAERRTGRHRHHCLKGRSDHGDWEKDPSRQMRSPTTGVITCRPF